MRSPVTPKERTMARMGSLLGPARSPGRPEKAPIVSVRPHPAPVGSTAADEEVAGPPVPHSAAGRLWRLLMAQTPRLPAMVDLPNWPMNRHGLGIDRDRRAESRGVALRARARARRGDDEVRHA